MWSDGGLISISHLFQLLVSFDQLQRPILLQLLDEPRVPHRPLAKLNEEPRPGLTQSHMVRHEDPCPPSTEFPRQALLEDMAPNMNIYRRKYVI